MPQKFYQLARSLMCCLLLWSCYQRYLLSEKPPAFQLHSNAISPLGVTHDGKLLKNRALIASWVDERRSTYLNGEQILPNADVSQEDNVVYYSFLWGIYPLNNNTNLLEQGLCTTSCFVDLRNSITDLSPAALFFRADPTLESGRYRLLLRIGDGSALNKELLSFSQEFELLPLLELAEDSKLTVDGLLSSQLELDPEDAIALSEDIPANSHSITVVLPRTPSASKSKLIFNNMQLVTTTKYDRITVLAESNISHYTADVFENNDLQTPVQKADLKDAIIAFDDDPAVLPLPSLRLAKIKLEITDFYGQIYLLSVTLKGNP